MFSGMLNGDDVEIIEGNNAQNVYYALSETCKNNIIYQPNNGNTLYLTLPTNAFIGKVVNITVFYSTGSVVKSQGNSGAVYVQHSNTNLFILKQGTVSFMYVGQQLNGLTATDKAKSGWIILGGVQGDTAITGYSGSVAIGSGAYCSNTNSVAIGANSSATAIWASAYGNSASASNNSTLAIGDSTSSTAQYANSLGYYAKAFASKTAFKSNSVFSANGDAQAGKFILMRQTTDATPLVLSATNATAATTNILTLPNNGTYAFEGIVVAKDASTLDSAMWEVIALMKRGSNASTTALVGTPTITKVFADAGASTWSIALTADTTNGGGIITVTGEASKTIRWVTNIDSAEVI